MNINKIIPPENTAIEEGMQIVAVGLGSIPIIGGTLASTANFVVSKRQNRRLNEFLVELSSELNRFQAQLNRDFAGTEQFADLAEEIFTKAADTRQKEKLDAFRSIFLNTVIGDLPDYDEAVEICCLVDRWQPRHVVLLKVAHDPLAFVKPESTSWEIAKERQSSFYLGLKDTARILVKYLGWTEVQVVRTWNDFIAAGLVVGINGEQVAVVHERQICYDEDRAIVLKGEFSEFALKVAEYISSPEPSE